MKTLVTYLMLLIFPMSAFAAQKAPLYTEEQTSISVTAEQPQFTIKLKSNPTTGFSWFLKAYDARYLEPGEHHFQPPENTHLMGAPGEELWSFRVKKEAFVVPQQFSLRFIYARPWEKTKAATELTYTISTTSAPSGSHPQKPR